MQEFSRTHIELTSMRMLRSGGLCRESDPRVVVEWPFTGPVIESER